MTCTNITNMNVEVEQRLTSHQTHYTSGRVFTGQIINMEHTSITIWNNVSLVTTAKNNRNYNTT